MKEEDIMIKDIYQKERTVFSFEVFPPKRNEEIEDPSLGFSTIILLE